MSDENRWGAPGPMTEAEWDAIGDALSMMRVVRAGKSVADDALPVAALKHAEACVRRFEGWRPGSLCGPGFRRNRVEEKP